MARSLRCTTFGSELAFPPQTPTTTVISFFLFDWNGVVSDRNRPRSGIDRSRCRTFREVVTFCGCIPASSSGVAASETGLLHTCKGNGMKGVLITMRIDFRVSWLHNIMMKARLHQTHTHFPQVCPLELREICQAIHYRVRGQKYQIF